MNKIVLVIVSLISVNMLFGLDVKDESAIRSIPILEVNGDKMPGWEKQIIEQYLDEEGGAVPVIFRGAAKNWEAASWTPEYFAERFGDEEIILVPQRLFEEGLDYGKDGKLESLKAVQMTMKDHIKDITFNPKYAGYFLGELEYNKTLAELLDEDDDSEEDNALDEAEGEDEDDKVVEEEGAGDDELTKNAIFVLTQLNLESQTRFPQSVAKGDVEEKRAYFVFIGSANTATTLHSHGSTFLSQIYGKKLATLVHPKHIKKCSCTWKEEKFVFRCDIDILKPDFEKYSELKEVEVYQTILEPGDVLYIPEGWLHDIRGISTSISIASGF